MIFAQLFGIKPSDALTVREFFAFQDAADAYLEAHPSEDDGTFTG